MDKWLAGGQETFVDLNFKHLLILESLILGVYLPKLQAIPIV